MDVIVSGCCQFPPLYRTESRSDPRTQGAPRANKRGRNSIEDSQTCQEIKLKLFFRNLKYTKRNLFLLRKLTIETKNE